MRRLRESFWTGAAALVVVTFICYAGSLRNSFHYDDSHSIVENHHIRKLSAVPAFFIDSGTFSNEASMAMYRPLLQASYAVNHALHGYDVAGYRLVNLLVHALCTVVVFAFVRKLGMSAIQAWCIGAAFALHPINSQLVNYISSRSELLYVLAVLGALYVHRFKGTRGAACVLYVLALLCKSAAVVFLPLVLLVELARGRQLRQALLQALPYALLTVAYLVVISMDGFLPRSLGQDVRPLDVQLFTQTKAIIFYLKLIAMPIGLSVEHAFVEATSFTDGTVVVSAVLILSVLALTIRSSARLPWVTMGVLWFFAGLMLTFIFPLNVLVNEHRLYLPLVGVLIVLGAVIRKGNASRTPLRIPASVSVALAVALLLTGASHTQARNAVWADEHTLWKDAVSKAPGMFRAQSNLGLALYERGELCAARVAFERSIEINPRYGKSWSNLGLVYEDIGLLERAEQSFERARQLSPELSGSYNNLGRLYSRLGRNDEAVPLLENAVRLDPHNVEAWVNLGRAYQRHDRLSSAEEAYRRAASLDASYAPAFNNLGLLLGELDRREEAGLTLQRAVQIDPSYTEAAVNLKLHQLADGGLEVSAAYRRVLTDFPYQVSVWKALAEKELKSMKWIEASVAFEHVVGLDSADVSAHENLATAYRNAGQTVKAIASYRNALQLDPSSIRIHNNLASALAATGDFEAALQLTRQALRINPVDDRARANLAKLSQVVDDGESR